MEDAARTAAAAGLPVVGELAGPVVSVQHRLFLEVTIVDPVLQLLAIRRYLSFFRVSLGCDFSFLFFGQGFGGYLLQLLNEPSDIEELRLIKLTSFSFPCSPVRVRVHLGNDFCGYTRTFVNNSSFTTTDT